MLLIRRKHLSGGRKPRKLTYWIQRNYDPPVEQGAGPAPSEPTPHQAQKPINADPYTERDEYGAELLKEARVWKIYVKEADRADAELVNGWNDSLDVILVFAALFSAISTAFLIESSQKLQEDPADVTAQTLLVISQTLSALVNGSQPTAPNPSPDDAAPFSPSRTIVVVNTLWYLSLSLSVATSLFAMLAKDWCYSFMAGRTGHPYDQTLRRQQKWMMLEKWKMQELIVVLPSLIHLSLLLFAIGLCIYVWELNTGVGIPVVCVTGLSLCFYLWSSFTASTVDYFPYTTIISRFLRTSWGRTMFGWLLRLLGTAGGLLLIPIKEFSWICRLMYRRFRLMLRRCQLVCIPAVRRTTELLDSIYCDDALFWFPLLDDLLQSWSESLSDWADRVVENPPPVLLRKDPPQHPDRFITLALQWLITSCEVPSVVDAALQAIAGAGSHTYREPLEKSNAALEIAKRLVSGNIYNSDDKHVVSLYVRSLQFLGSNQPSEMTTQSNAGATGELQVTIWNLQTQYDKQVAQLVADGDFTPSDQNIEALRIGSSIASHVLRVVDGSEQTKASPLETVLRLLENHYLKSNSLHPAALKSLFNTFELLSIITTDCKMLLQLIHQLVILSRSWGFLPPYPIDPDDRTQEALRCAYILAQSLHQHVLDSTTTPDAPLPPFAGKIIQHIAKSHTMSLGELALQTLSSVLEVRGRPYLSSIRLSFDELDTAIRLAGVFGPGNPWISGSDTQTLDYHFHRAIPGYFWPLYGEHEIGLPVWSNLSSRVCLFVVEVMICTQSDDLKGRCRYLLAHLPFPKLSPDLVDVLEKQDIIPFLEQASTSPDEELQLLTISLLWLLCAVEAYAPPGTDDVRYRLKTQLRRCTTWGGLREMKGALGNRLFVHDRVTWTEDKHFWCRRFLARVLGCVVEAGDYVALHTEDPADNALVEELKEWIARYSPSNPSLRGLASFTAYPNHSQPTAEKEPPQSEPHAIIDVPGDSAPESSPS